MYGWLKNVFIPAVYARMVKKCIYTCCECTDGLKNVFIPAVNARMVKKATDFIHRRSQNSCHNGGIRRMY